MSTYPAVPVTESGPGLSQVERVVDAYVAPSKTFRDILRSSTWWLPALLLILSALATSYVVDHKVGFDRVNENAIHASPKREAALENATPEQRAQQMKMGTAITKGIAYGVPVLLLIVTAIYALILWGTFNFALGAQTTFTQVYAVCFYASLPYFLLNLLTIASIYFGNNADAFNFQNPVGTNLGYYLPDIAPALRALLARIDLMQLWIVALTIYGMAIVAKKTVMQSALIVGGFWVLATLFAVGGAAFS